MSRRRQQLLRDAASFLGASGTRPRAVVVGGVAGIGKTTFLDRLQVEILAAGRTSVIVIDDAHHASEDDIAALDERLSSDVRSCLLVASETVPPSLMRVIDRRCERRVIDVPILEDDAVRELLAELGVRPWTFHASQIVRDGGGVPRAIVDLAFGELDPVRLPREDTSFDGERWSERAARRMELAFVHDAEALEEFLATAAAEVLDDGLDSAARAEAHAVLSEIRLRESNLESAIRLGERAAGEAKASEAARILGASSASAARALRGEPTGMLSLHALAGRASRTNLPIVETALWHLVAWCAGVLGDVVTSRRAAIRSVQLADAHDAVLMGLRARLLLADLHIAANEPEAAAAYYAEIAAVSEHRGLTKLRIDARAGEARSALAAGEVAVACAAIDEALELVFRSNGTRIDVVEVAVVAARAYAAGGSVELALAPLDALVGNLGDSHSPDFWLVLEAIRILGRAGSDPAAFQRWLSAFAQFDADGHGGALRAAHAEADAWRAAAAGRRAEAARLAERARQLWVTAECHDELPLTDALIQQAPVEHGPRVSLVGGPSQRQEDPEAFEALTRREREIARYVAGGLTNPEIAAELHLSPRTVEHHVASILRKLELPSRRALVRGRV